MQPKDLFGRGKKVTQSIVPEGLKGGVFYIRISTKEQSEDLEAQKEAILEFANQTGIFQIGTWFEEHASGKGVEKRPVLMDAFKLAKEHNAFVVTSKLDRLSRNSAFINNLIEKNFKFVTCEHGFDADPLILRIIAAVNQKEREKIGQRTKDAMAQIKKRYDEEYKEALKTDPNAKKKRLGIPDVSKAPTHISHVRKQAALEDARRCWGEYIKPVIDELYSELHKKPTRSQISERMNARSDLSKSDPRYIPKNKYDNPWTPSILYHMISKLKRAGEYEEYPPRCDSDSDCDD
jgi:DNA invertase Pin-like site-specific DNA recombinase